MPLESMATRRTTTLAAPAQPMYFGGWPRWALLFIGCGHNCNVRCALPVIAEALSGCPVQLDSRLAGWLRLRSSLTVGAYS